MQRIPTNIPLATLGARVEDALPELCRNHVHAANAIRNAGIEYLWQLLVQCEASLLKTKNFGRESLKKVHEALSDKGWKLGALYPYTGPLLVQINSSPWKKVQLLAVVGPEMPLLTGAAHEEVAHLLTSHGLHANMTIDELFVYIPTERPPLTEEQVAFLGQWPRDVFTAADELAWWHMHVSNTVRNRVFNIAVLLPHLRSDDEHKETIARIRARIEAEVGPLPLALSSDELRNFFR